MAKIIVIIVVMVVINAFMINVILRVSNRVNEKVNKHFLKKIAEIVPLDDTPRKKEIDEDAEKQEVIVEKVAVYSSDFKDEKNIYKTNDFRDDYKNIKEKMVFNTKNVVKDIIEENKSSINSLGKQVIELVRMFDVETIYNLNTLPSYEQKKILMESFDENQKNILNDYLNIINDDFNIIKFYEYLSRIAKHEDPTFYVKTGSQQDYYDDISMGIVTVHDDNITEGIKVVHKDKVYDYSI